ncbi:helix-turn-helix domain-containing protein [Streptomyces fructofermentans]|uniref:helix-turn-helix domain-containing protein n=1 Tax=Streptomyces fructofermentans TaxID=152141 RepID=UPI0034107D9C
MPRWRPLPESLALPARRLVVQMRQAKDHSGLSLSALANRTGYSRSSWERCLNGRALPPLWALEALADACGGDRTELTALWEVAASADAPDTTGSTGTPAASGTPRAADAAPHTVDAPHTTDTTDATDATDAPGTGEASRTAEAPRVEHSPGPAEAGDSGEPPAGSADGVADGSARYPAEPPASGRPVRRIRRGTAAVASATTAVVLLVMAGVLAMAQPWEQSPEPRGTAERPAVPVSTYSARTFPCHFTVREGLWYAGHSTTLTDPYSVGTTVEAVAEVQCLVKRHGFDPEGIDASFGPKTRAAVQRFQRSRGLDDDGMVGPMTWRALREPSG